ncbi:MAG: tetraacyldisaccharide 4'-kinase [Burkholderiales bacterium]
MRRGLMACLLWPLSLLFRLLVACRLVLYRLGVLKSGRAPVPVIVVGNIYVGGTGKTPLTIWLVDALQRAGYVPGVVSRGHGVQNNGPVAVTSASAPQQVGDEPVLIAQRAHCPLMVGRNRLAAAQALLSLHPQVNVIVSDDGLQHYALQRDIEIVLFDARGRGNGWLLPAGPLREPASRRRDFTVINAASRTPDWPDAAVQMRLAGSVAEHLQDRSQVMPLASLAQSSDPEARGRRIAAAAGIGHPERFFGMLRDAGLTFDRIPLPDHFDFNEFSFYGVAADVILITEKDAVKCQHIAALRDDLRLWVVPVTAHLDSVLIEQIVEKLRGHPTA